MTKSVKKPSQTTRKNSVGGAAAGLAHMGFDKNQMAAASLLYPQLAAAAAVAAAASNPAALYLNPLLLNNQLAMTANLLQQQQQLGRSAFSPNGIAASTNSTTSAAAAGIIKSATNLKRLNSRSTSNDSSSSLARQINKSNTNSAGETSASTSGGGGGTTPGTGLKLVLKRQQGDKYEVKAPSNEINPATGRPKRQAARKVKFTFSEYETDMDNSPEKKRPKLTWSSSLMAPVSPFHLQPKRSLSSSIDPSVAFFSNNLVKISQHHDMDQNVFVEESDEEDEEDDEEEEDDDDESNVLFHSSDIVRHNFSDKVKIMLNQPNVILTTTKPFPIALVEDKTNIICTKALIHMHLFQSYGSQCINCLICNNFLTIAEFSKHLHKAEDDDDEDFNELTKKSFKVLPYRVNKNEELSESDLDVWRTFGKRYGRFKQEHLAKLKQLKLQHELLEQQRLKDEISKEQSSLVKNWDSISEDKTLYSIAKEKLEFNQVVIESSTERLSEDEELDDDNESKKENKKREEEQNDESLTSAKAQLDSSKQQIVVDDLSLSEDEDYESTKSSIDLTKLENECVKQSDQMLNDEQVKHRSRIFDNPDSDQMSPSIQEKYINLYDNMNQTDLLSICDNAITIIPDSFIAYMISKHQSNMVNLKLAKTNYYKMKWLSQSLDLECKREFVRPRCTIKSIQQQLQQQQVSSNDQTNNNSNSVILDSNQ